MEQKGPGHQVEIDPVTGYLYRDMREPVNRVLDLPVDPAVAIQQDGRLMGLYLFEEGNQQREIGRPFLEGAAIVLKRYRDTVLPCLVQAVQVEGGRIQEIVLPFPDQ